MTNENFRSNEYIGQQSIECRKKKKIKQISSNFLCIMPVLLYFSFNFIDQLKKAMYIGRTKIQKNEEKIFICYSIFMKEFFLRQKKRTKSQWTKYLACICCESYTAWLLEKVWINKSSMSKQCRILCQLQIFSTKWKFIYRVWKLIFDL